MNRRRVEYHLFNKNFINTENKILKYALRLKKYMKNVSRDKIEKITGHERLMEAYITYKRLQLKFIYIIYRLVTDSIVFFIDILNTSPLLYFLFSCGVLIWLTKRAFLLVDELLLFILGELEKFINPLIDVINDVFVNTLRNILEKLCRFCLCINIGPVHISSHIFKFLCPSFSDISHVNLSSSGTMGEIVTVLKDLQCSYNNVFARGIYELLFTARLYFNNHICYTIESTNNVVFKWIIKTFAGWLTFQPDCRIPNDPETWICYLLNFYTLIYFILFIHVLILFSTIAWPTIMRPLYHGIYITLKKLFTKIRNMNGNKRFIYNKSNKIKNE